MGPGKREIALGSCAAGVGVPQLGDHGIGLAGQVRLSRRRIPPESGERFSGEGRPCSQTQQIDDRGWQVAEADRLAHDRRRIETRRRSNHQGHSDLRPIETLTVVKQVVFTQPLTMIRGHDDQCLIEHAVTLQCVKEQAKLLVEITQAVVIRIASEINIGRR